MGLQYSSPSCVASDPSPTGTASSGSPQAPPSSSHKHHSCPGQQRKKQTNKSTHDYMIKFLQELTREVITTFVVLYHTQMSILLYMIAGFDLFT